MFIGSQEIIKRQTLELLNYKLWQAMFTHLLNTYGTCYTLSKLHLILIYTAHWPGVNATKVENNFYFVFYTLGSTHHIRSTK